MAEEVGNTTLSCPGRRIKREEWSDSDIKELDSRKASLYRALAARSNYMAQDRTDIRYSVKEVSRRMSKPRYCDWQALVRIAK